MKHGPARLGRRRVAIVAGLVAGLAALVALGTWLSNLGPGARSLADRATPEQLARGRAVYAAHCASCHGRDLEGEPNWRERKPNGRLPAPPHDDSGHTWHHPDDVLFGITKHGLRPPYAPLGYESDMPAFAGVLTDDEIWAVLGYIASRWSPRERAHQARLSRQQIQMR